MCSHPLEMMFCLGKHDALSKVWKLQYFGYNTSKMANNVVVKAWWSTMTVSVLISILHIFRCVKKILKILILKKECKATYVHAKKSLKQLPQITYLLLFSGQWPTLFILYVDSFRHHTDFVLGSWQGKVFLMSGLTYSDNSLCSHIQLCNIKCVCVCPGYYG